MRGVKTLRWTHSRLQIQSQAADRLEESEERYRLTLEVMVSLCAEHGMAIFCALSHTESKTQRSLEVDSSVAWRNGAHGNSRDGDADVDDGT